MVMKEEKLLGDKKKILIISWVFASFICSTSNETLGVINYCPQPLWSWDAHDFFLFAEEYIINL